MQTLGEAFMAPEVQMQQIETSRAQQKLYESQAAQQQFELGQAQKMGKLMESMATPEGAMQQTADPSALLEQVAHRFMGIGMAEKAADLFGKASQIRERQANTQQNIALTRKQEVEGWIKAIDLSQNLMSNVRSQADLDRANSLWAGLTGTMSPLFDQLYTPELINKFNDQVLAAKGQLTNQTREADFLRKQAETESKQAMREGVLSLKEQRLAQQQRELELKGKVGGKAVGTPDKTEMEQAKILIRQAYPSFKGETDLLGQAAFDIASESKAIRLKNPGISAGESLQQAFEKAKANGDFSVVESIFSGVLPKSVAEKVATPQYKQPKAPPAEAAVPAPSERVVGKTSIVKDGKTYIWTEAGGQRGWAPAPGGK